MRWAVVGLSHHTAPIVVRESLAKRLQDVRAGLRQLLHDDGLREACILATCNRIEVYALGSADAAQAARVLRRHLLSLSGLAPEDLEPHLYQHVGIEAVRHLFRVSGSLDSMVLGEPQILGQVKEAFRLAAAEGAAGPSLRRVFERSFAVAKRVRTETGVGENAISMSFAAVELGRQIFDSLEGKQVLLVGAGKMASLAARHLRSQGVAEIRVASRSLETAARLAQAIGGYASSLTDLPLLLTTADIVICSTASPTPVIDRRMMSRVVRERRYRSILFVDIAVPRDVHPAVGELDNVFVYDLDDLEGVLADNREMRAKEAQSAERLVASEVAAFEKWTRSQQVVPVIKALRQFATEIALKESERTLSAMPHPEKKAIESVRAMGQAIVNKLLHPALSRLKAEGADGAPERYAEVLTDLFGLELSRFEDTARDDLAPPSAPAPGTTPEDAPVSEDEPRPPRGSGPGERPRRERESELDSEPESGSESPADLRFGFGLDAGPNPGSHSADADDDADAPPSNVVPLRHKESG